MKQETQFDAEIRVQDNAEKVFRAARGKSGKGVTVNAKALGMTRSERRRATSEDVLQIARLVKSI